MTDNEINIAIAQVSGYTQEEPWLNGRECWSHKDHPSHVGFDEIPDYCNDLNAIDEAVMSLSPEMRKLFRKELQYLIAPETRPGPARQVVLMSVDSFDAWFHSTARQRAEAFLKTLNKWTD